MAGKSNGHTYSVMHTTVALVVSGLVSQQLSGPFDERDKALWR